MSNNAKFTAAAERVEQGTAVELSYARASLKETVARHVTELSIATKRLRTAEEAHISAVEVAQELLNTFLPAVRSDESVRTDTINRLANGNLPTKRGGGR